MHSCGPSQLDDRINRRTTGEGTAQSGVIGNKLVCLVWLTRDGRRAETMTSYTVTYRRDPGDDAWVIDIEGMADVHTFGRNLDEAATNAREAIAVTADIPESSVEIDERICVADVDVDELARLRDQALEAHEIYLARQRAAALRLTEAGVSRRDAARLLGVSHQRVQQLVAD